MERLQLSLLNFSTQKAVLRQLAELVARSIVKPNVYMAARAITNDCPSRDDMCELKAIFDAVKTGTEAIEGLRNGFRYVADPISYDYFTSPSKNLEFCEKGACGGDCDDHAGLNAALAAALGWKVGLRAWGQKGKEYQHVYCVIAYPKKNPTQEMGMDTTVAESYVGWEPPPGNILTAWLD